MLTPQWGLLEHSGSSPRRVRRQKLFDYNGDDYMMTCVDVVLYLRSVLLESVRGLVPVDYDVRMMRYGVASSSRFFI